MPGDVFRKRRRVEERCPIRIGLGVRIAIGVSLANGGEHVFQNFLRPLPERAALSIVRSGDGGRLQVVVLVTIGRVYVLETSSNLDQWTPLLTNSAPFTLEAPWTALTLRRFYRAVPLTE